MKESELKKIMTTPVMDETMDQNIAEALLNYSTDSNMKSRRIIKSNLPKIAAAILVLVTLGTGAVLASSYFVRTYLNDIEIKSAQELGIDLDEQVSDLYGDDTVKKHFGAGEGMVSQLKYKNGGATVTNEDGFYVFENGSRLVAPGLTGSDRHENARISGEDAFVELGYPNLVPSYIYEHYILDDSGFICYENETDNTVNKWLMARFSDSADYLSKLIYVTFIPRESPVKGEGNIYFTDDKTDEDFIHSGYTTKNGVQCSIVEEIGGNINAHIFFEIDTIGNGEIMFEFDGFEMDKVKEILDTVQFGEGI